MTASEGMAKQWLGKLTRLNPATGKGECQGKAPHKPLLLLCLLDMAENGEFPSRVFSRSPGLVLRFRSYGTLVVGRWPSRMDLKLPFFNLKIQNFWDAFDSGMQPAGSPETCAVCEMNSEFFELMGDAGLFRISVYLRPHRLPLHFRSRSQHCRCRPYRTVAGKLKRRSRQRTRSQQKCPLDV